MSRGAFDFVDAFTVPVRTYGDDAYAYDEAETGVAAPGLVRQESHAGDRRPEFTSQADTHEKGTSHRARASESQGLLADKTNGSNKLS